jgi:hypothetical protein
VSGRVAQRAGGTWGGWHGARPRWGSRQPGAVRIAAGRTEEVAPGLTVGASGQRITDLAAAAQVAEDRRGAARVWVAPVGAMMARAQGSARRAACTHLLAARAGVAPVGAPGNGSFDRWNGRCDEDEERNQRRHASLPCERAKGSDAAESTRCSHRSIRSTAAAHAEQSRDGRFILGGCTVKCQSKALS